ncbi:MAG: plasmid pRiA4b ORF-3 family protein [Proteobacteria bacterium]|nr:plasmid pRiA4b ORF-3 family protein [Pseudomonadota bacterium]
MSICLGSYRMPTRRRVYDFTVTLLQTKPTVWRRIQVPEKYSFWDLHVAIQDSMGWLDCHLHAFRFGKVGTTEEIGIPVDEGFSDLETLPGWEIPIKDHFEIGTSCTYEYDFGDGWIHEVTLQGVVLAEKGKRYPICLDGAMACPPEDCGGIGGYYHLIEVFADPDDEEYEELLSWLGRPFDAKAFDSSLVRFDNPTKRWDHVFSDGI